MFSEDDLGIRHSELVDWYLKEMESEIETEAELIDKKTVCEKVIYRLIHHVRRMVLLLYLVNIKTTRKRKRKKRFYKI